MSPSHQQHHYSSLPTISTSTTALPLRSLSNNNNDGLSSSSSSSSLSSSTTTNVTSAEASYWVKIVSGSVGSMITALAVTPLEVVKVRQQASPSSPFPTSTKIVSSSSSSSISNNYNKSICRQLATGDATFVLNNGLCECVLPKCSVPYFSSSTSNNTMKAAATTTTTTMNPSIQLVRSSVPSATATTTSSSSSSSSSVGILKMMRRILRTEGWSGLYAGLRPTLVMGVPNTVFYFVTYEELSTQFYKTLYNNNNSSSYQHNNNNNNNIIPPIAGGLARLLASGLTAPLELVRTRQAAYVANLNELTTTTTTNMSQRLGMISEIQTIIRTEGMFALYKGLSPTLWRDVPFSAIYWFSLEKLRTFWKLQQQQQQHNNNNNNTISIYEQGGQALINGTISGMIAAACTTPMDVIKTRRQVDISATTTTTTNTKSGKSFSGSSSSSNSTHQIVKTILKQEGISGLWRGNQTRMLKVAPACAIMISSYEIGKRVLTESS